MGKRISVFRKEHFNAAHRLHNPAWTEEKNYAVFGKCNNPHFHGHNYELVVKLVGETDDDTGYLMDLKLLSDIIQEHVIEKFDHRNLNQDCEAFRDLNPTAENITVVIYDILRPILPATLLLQVRLYETPRNFAEYPVEPA